MSISIDLAGTMLPDAIKKFDEARKANTCPMCGELPAYRKNGWVVKHAKDCPQEILNNFFGFKS